MSIYVRKRIEKKGALIIWITWILKSYAYCCDHLMVNIVWKNPMYSRFHPPFCTLLLVFTFLSQYFFNKSNWNVEIAMATLTAKYFSSKQFTINESLTILSLFVCMTLKPLSSKWWTLSACWCLLDCMQH